MLADEQVGYVIIPSAALVPGELRNLGKLPAVIYPLNQKIVFDYLYERYREKCRHIRVLCYAEAEKVHRRLERYPHDKVEIEDLPELKDLGYTVYCGLQGISSPVIINFADTIVMQETECPIRDSIYYSEDHVSDTWTFFRENEGVITEIIDKESAGDCWSCREKLVVGIFCITDPVCLRECLEVAFDGYDGMVSTFYHALKLYSQRHPLAPVKTDSWFDIGHADTYYHSSVEVKAREFNHISVDRNRGILRKTSDDRDKFVGEIKWYLKLPGDIEYVRPRIFDYSVDHSSPYISMEYYAYHTVHELFLYGDLTRRQWTDIFSRIRFICDDLRRYTVRDGNIRAALEDVYLKKTRQRFDQMRKDERFAGFFSKEITVNKIRYRSLDRIMEQLESVIPEMLYDVEEFCIIHGDLCFANIMVDGNLSFVKLIDPRGKFGGYDIYGDFRYELAKLFHSIDGRYDFIIKDMFRIEYDLEGAVVSYAISDRSRGYDLYDIFIEVFDDEIGCNIKKIELIEALLFLSMIPLHSESLEHQMAMLGTGIEILSRIIDIRVTED